MNHQLPLIICYKVTGFIINPRNGFEQNSDVFENILLSLVCAYLESQFSSEDKFPRMEHLLRLFCCNKLQHIPSLTFPFQYLTNIRTRYISWLQSINLNINHVNIQWLHTSQWHTSKISFVSWFRKLPFYLVIGGHQSPHLFNIRLSSIIFKLQFWFIITGSYLS